MAKITINGSTDFATTTNITWTYAEVKDDHEVSVNSGDMANTLKAKFADGETLRKDVIKSWGIDIDLNLITSAADFYLLYEMYLDDKDEGHFEELLYGLVDQFVSYTDMILGGELRHMGRVDKIKGIENLAPEIVEIFYHGSRTASMRYIFWEKWKVFRELHPDALQWAADAFRAFGQGSVGGEKWALIAEMLQFFEKGEITPLMFVDFCWGTEHNGGTYFNKIWSGKVREVLNANLEGNTWKLEQWASDGVREFYRSKK